MDADKNHRTAAPAIQPGKARLGLPESKDPCIASIQIKIEGRSSRAAEFGLWKRISPGR